MKRRSFLSKINNWVIYILLTLAVTGVVVASVILILSPQNYVSARAEVQALLWSKKQPWFNEFFDGFPTQGNGMKMKSGTMKNTKSFAGYHTSGDGKKYVFAIIINNYQSSNLRDALYKVLNVLK